MMIKELDSFTTKNKKLKKPYEELRASREKLKKTPHMRSWYRVITMNSLSL
jgi:type II restriction/modification system DNA methylase subunit YeeA